MTDPRHEASEHDQNLADISDRNSVSASDRRSRSAIADAGRSKATHPPDETAEETRRRPPPHRRDADTRPTGTPTSDRHATETAHQWEDEHPEPGSAAAAHVPASGGTAAGSPSIRARRY
jgi:hypothetical protein